MNARLIAGAVGPHFTSLDDFLLPCSQDGKCSISTYLLTASCNGAFDAHLRSKLMMGDEVSIKADFVAALSVTLEIENDLYSSPLEIESVSLTLDKASELANALPIRGGLN